METPLFPIQLLGVLDLLDENASNILIINNLEGLSYKHKDILKANLQNPPLLKSLESFKSSHSAKELLENLSRILPQFNIDSTQNSSINDNLSQNHSLSNSNSSFCESKNTPFEMMMKDYKTASTTKENSEECSLMEEGSDSNQSFEDRNGDLPLQADCLPAGIFELNYHSNLHTDHILIEHSSFSNINREENNNNILSSLANTSIEQKEPFVSARFNPASESPHKISITESKLAKESDFKVSQSLNDLTQKAESEDNNLCKEWETMSQTSQSMNSKNSQTQKPNEFNE